MRIGQALRYGGIPVDPGMAKDIREEIKPKIETGWDGLMIIPEEVREVKAGEKVRV